MQVVRGVVNVLFNFLMRSLSANAGEGVLFFRALALLFEEKGTAGNRLFSPDRSMTITEDGFTPQNM